MTFRPMLAFSCTEDEVKFPVLTSVKLDGLRAVVKDGKLYTRSLKPFANKATVEFFERPELEGFDGELIVGEPTAKDCFLKSTSGLRNMKGDPQAVFYVFDLHDSDESFLMRQHRLSQRVSTLPDDLISRVKWVKQTLAHSKEELLKFEAEALEAGYEGLILKNPDSQYRLGRSRDMLKLKRFTDDEADLLGMIQMYMNDNDPRLNELGYTERSDAREGMVPVEMMGALVVRDRKTGKVFSIGTGFDFATRRMFWENRGCPALVNDHSGSPISGVWVFGRAFIVKYKHFTVGNYDLPRFPVYIGERLPEDL